MKLFFDKTKFSSPKEQVAALVIAGITCWIKGDQLNGGNFIAAANKMIKHFCSVCNVEEAWNGQFCRDAYNNKIIVGKNMCSMCAIKEEDNKHYQS